MKLIPNESMKIITKRYSKHIRYFVKINLKNPSHYDALNVSLDYFEISEKDDMDCGRITMNSDYLYPKIRLFKNGIDHLHYNYFHFKYTRRNTDLLVLFHELTHLFIALNDCENRKWFFEDPTAVIDDQEEEDMCNEMAERYLRENGLISLKKPPTYYNLEFK